MPEGGIALRDKAEFMRQEELFQIVDEFVSLGVKKIRLTGGEPLIKKDFAEILQYLSKLKVDLHITTNGILLDKYWDELEQADIKGINISIDSLQKERFNSISRRDYFDRVRGNIDKAIDKGFNVKLNVVLMKGVNDDEIIKFIEFGKTKKVIIRFIEFMPFDGNEWDRSKTVDYSHILKTAEAHFGELTPLDLEANFTSRNFQVPDFEGSFGIISSISNPFCDSCNRIRLTADGKIKNCLFSNQETDLLSALRNKEAIQPLILSSISKKAKSRAGLKSFDDENFTFKNRSMTAIGG
jgi:molybdenum cofactor biosynthesis protein A